MQLGAGLQYLPSWQAELLQQQRSDVIRFERHSLLKKHRNVVLVKNVPTAGQVNQTNCGVRGKQLLTTSHLDEGSYHRRQ